jgi:hypothetical protein
VDPNSTVSVAPAADIFVQVAVATSCEVTAPQRLKSLQKIPYNKKKFSLTLQNLLIRPKFCGKF